jgi:hypothetical protein
MIQKTKSLNTPIIVVLAVFLSAYLLSMFKTELVDWNVFYGASIRSPYSQFGFLNPYWLKIIISPFNLAGFKFGFYLFFVSSLLVILLLLKKESKFIVAMIFLSPFMMSTIIDGQIDSIVVIGYILLKQNNIWGMPLVLIKPQVLIGSAITFFVHAGRISKIKMVVLMSFLFFLGIALYGNWILDMYNNISTDLYHPISIAWVFHSPILFLILFSIGMWKKNLFLSGISILFVTPYIASHSLWVYWAAFLLERPNWKIVIVVLAASWAFALSMS